MIMSNDEYTLYDKLTTKEDLVNTESFRSQYRHQMWLEQIKNNIGMESIGGIRETVLSTMFKNSDEKEVLTSLVKLTLCYYESSCLVRVSQSNDLFLSIIDQLPDNIELNSKHIIAYVDGARVSIAELLNELKNTISRNYNESDGVCDGTAITAAIASYVKNVKCSDEYADVPCVKTFLKTQFNYCCNICSSNCLLDDIPAMYSFTKYISKISENDRWYYIQLLNGFLLRYYRILINILDDVNNRLNVLSKPDTDVIKLIKSNIVPLDKESLNFMVKYNYEMLNTQYLIPDMAGAVDTRLTEKSNIWGILHKLCSCGVARVISAIEPAISLVKLGISKKDHSNKNIICDKYGPYGVYHDTNNPRYLYVVREKDSNQCLFNIELIPYDAIIRESTKILPSSSIKMFSTNNGAISDMYFVNYYANLYNTLNMSQYQVLKDGSSFDLFTEIVVKMGQDLVKLSQKTILYNRLYMEYCDENDASIFDDFFYYDDLSKLLNGIDRIFAIDSSAEQVVTVRVSKLIKKIFDLQNTDVLKEATIDHNWLNDLALINNKLEPALRTIGSMANMPQSSPFRCSDELEDRYVDMRYEQYVMLYYRLYHLLMALWGDVTYNIILPCNLYLNSLSENIQMHISKTFIKIEE